MRSLSLEEDDSLETALFAAWRWFVLARRFGRGGSGFRLRALFGRPLGRSLRLVERGDRLLRKPTTADMMLDGVIINSTLDGVTGEHVSSPAWDLFRH